MSNYLYYDFQSSMVCKVKEDKNEYMHYPNIIQYLNIQCLENGSNYKGRKEAFQFITKQKKFTPIVISIQPVIIYFPTSSIKDDKCKWINYGQIEKVEYKEKECTIFFKDHTFLICTHPKRIENSILHIRRYLIMQPNSYNPHYKMNNQNNKTFHNEPY